MTTLNSKTNFDSITNLASISDIFHSSNITYNFIVLDDEGNEKSETLIIDTDLDSSNGIFGKFTITFKVAKTKLFILTFDTMKLTVKSVLNKKVNFDPTNLIEHFLNNSEITTGDQRLLIIFEILKNNIEKSENNGLLTFLPITKKQFSEATNLIADKLEKNNIAFQSRFTILKKFVNAQTV